MSASLVDVGGTAEEMKRDYAITVHESEARVQAEVEANLKKLRAENDLVNGPGNPLSFGESALLVSQARARACSRSWKARRRC